MESRRLLGSLGASGLAVSSGVFARRKLLKAWRSNPDPLAGRPAKFPDGEIRRITVDDGASIETVTVGEGPTVVLVHGLTTSRHDWGPIGEHLLESGKQLITVDQRGHGGSTTGVDGYGSSRLGKDLRAVFEQLDVHAEALIGHSMGGMASMAFAVEHGDCFAERVENLVLIATAAELDTARHRAALHLGGVALPERLWPHNDRLRLGAGLFFFGREPSLNMIDEGIAAFRATPERVRTEATKSLLKHDVVGQLGEIATPTLVIGAGRDQIIFPKQVVQLADGIASAELEMFDDAGHMVIWEKHVEIAALINDLLRRARRQRRAESL